ncbi:MAG: peptidoglycan recognition protein family protein [Elusimicrobiales bacterium]|nr:peptidoglycan recognition protein family protein [Elusimicrobiales bacterium]
MKATLKNILLALLFAAAGPQAAFADEIAAKFKGLPYPIEVVLDGSQKAGDVLFQTPYSEPPAAAYNTILVQGLMPDPEVKVEFSVKPKNLLAKPPVVTRADFRRYANGRFWAKFRVPLTSQPVRLSVLDLGAAAASTLAIYETELLVEEDTKEAPVPFSTATYVPDPAWFVPANAPFRLIRRQAWSAQPPTEAYSTHTPTGFTLHHTQGNYPQTLQAAINEVQFVQDYHQTAKEWIDIGYHFLIDPAGNIFEGRPIGVIGAHVLRKNPGNIGISIIGNYHPPVSNPITPASLGSFVSVGSYVKDTYSIQVSSFYAHRDIGNTDCPGDDLYAKKTQLSALIFTPQTRPVQVVPANAPPLSPAQQRALKLLMDSFD